MYVLIVTFLIITYIVLSIAIVRYVKKPFSKIIAVLIVIFIPISDSIPRYIWFLYNCKYNTGIYISCHASNLGFIEKEPYYFSGIYYPSKDLSDADLKKSINSIKRHILMHNLRQYMFDNGLFTEVAWRDLRNYQTVYGRFWVDNIGNNNCLAEIHFDDYKEVCGERCVRKNKCIAGVKINNFSTKYHLEEVVDNEDFGMIKNYSKITDIETGKVLVQKNSYDLNISWLSGLWKWQGSTNSCGASKPCLTKEIATRFYENASKNRPFSPYKNDIFCSE